MNQFPAHIQNAIDLGLLTVEDGKVTAVNENSVDTVTGISRIVDKLQPTTAAEVSDTTDQEAIVLCRVLSSPPGVARELWTKLRVGLGMGHSQPVPFRLWSTPEFRAIGDEIDRTFMGERDSELINRESLIRTYSSLNAASRRVDVITFNQTISELADPETMKSYGDADSEWAIALDLLRQSRVKALFEETLHEAAQTKRTDTKIEKAIEHLQSRTMECLGMLRGSIGQQGNSKTMMEMLFGNDENKGLIDEIEQGTEEVLPFSTGIPAMDIDMEGGVYPHGSGNTGGRLFTLAARTGVGKTQLGTDACVGLASQGMTVGFVSAELDEREIWYRITSCATRKFNDNTNWVSVGDMKQPATHKRQQISSNIANASMAMTNSGGEVLVEAPWGADVKTVVNILRSMKARKPELRCAVIDHFHCLSRHKGAPTNESAMMEERAYELMTVAKELGIDIIILAQMNRVGMDALSAKNSPGLDQIRGTDALSHVSHAVWIVRKEASTEDDPNTDRDLEFWHVKTRGRQAFVRNGQVVGTRGFVEKSILKMDYKHSSVRTDDTTSQL